MGKSWEEFACMGKLREKQKKYTFSLEFVLLFYIFSNFLVYFAESVYLCVVIT